MPLQHITDKALFAVVHLQLSLLSILFPFAEAIYDYCGGNLTVTGVRATAGIFATYPAPYLSLLAGFIDQVAMKPDERITATNHDHLMHSALTLCFVVLFYIQLS